jgi:hypothetical protein
MYYSMNMLPTCWMNVSDMLREYSLRYLTGAGASAAPSK